VALVTGGPGVSNAATALLTAKGNQSPVVLLSGEPATSVEHRGAQQEADHVLLTEGTTKASLRVTRGDRVVERLQEAFRIAESGRTGPVHLTIPADVQQEPLTIDAVPSARRPVAGPVAPPAFVAAVAARVRGARRPLLIAGAGVWQHGGEAAVAALAAAHGLPVFTLDSARGIAPDGSACVLGTADPGLNPAALHVAEADCVILAGRDADFRIGYGSMFRADAAVVHVDPEVAGLGRNLPEDALLAAGDPAAFLADLAAALGEHRVEAEWSATVAGSRSAEDASADGEGAHPGAVADAIARAGLAADAIFALDCGEFVQWCRARIPAQTPGSWLRLGPQATCGAGLPFGIGAQAAAPDRPVVVIAGDGGLGYHVSELETAVREGLPLVVVVGQDGAWGIERLLQTGLYGDDAAFTSDLTATDYAMVARGFGADARTVGDAEELETALRAAIEARRPALIRVGIRNVASRGTERMIASLRAS
jgi:acetolactate synthase-1/2/3 large subunit